LKPQVASYAQKIDQAIREAQKDMAGR